MSPAAARRLAITDHTIPTMPAGVKKNTVHRIDQIR
jgi:hypothetical protein